MEFVSNGGCDSKHNIAYKLRKEKINGVRKHGGCDFKTRYHLQTKERKK